MALLCICLKKKSRLFGENSCKIHYVNTREALQHHVETSGFKTTVSLLYGLKVVQGAWSSQS